MEDIFLTEIHIKSIRHLRDIKIPLSETERKHLILTGKNGSGKTSVLEVLRDYLNNFYDIRPFRRIKEYGYIKNVEELKRIYPKEYNRQLKNYYESKVKENFSNFNHKIVNSFNQSPNLPIQKGKFISTYFPARRTNTLETPSGIMKYEVQTKYNLKERANKNFLQFLVNMKAERAFAKDEGHDTYVKEIDSWFASFTDLLQEIFEDKSIKLRFNYLNYSFGITQKNKIGAIDFTTLSDGYTTIFNIVTELMMRMENSNAKIYDVQGIVLIDEIETHLHIDLQKKIMPFLTKIFPKIQFIVTTHSPFVLSSEANAVVFDLEKKILVEDMSGFSLDSVVEGYFDSDKYSQILKNKITEYELLYNKKELSEKEEDRLVELKLYFKGLPTSLSPELALKLNQIKFSKISARK